MPRTFVLLVDDEPVGMASLDAHDLDTRPDLTPWLAGVFVAPHARAGATPRLVAAVEAFAASLGVATLWLYTAPPRGSTPGSAGGRSRRFPIGTKCTR